MSHDSFEIFAQNSYRHAIIKTVSSVLVFQTIINVNNIKVVTVEYEAIWIHETAIDVKIKYKTQND